MRGGKRCFNDPAPRYCCRCRENINGLFSHSKEVRVFTQNPPKKAETPCRPQGGRDTPIVYRALPIFGALRQRCEENIVPNHLQHPTSVFCHTLTNRIKILFSSVLPAAAVEQHGHRSRGKYCCMRSVMVQRYFRLPFEVTYDSTPELPASGYLASSWVVEQMPKKLPKRLSQLAHNFCRQISFGISQLRQMPPCIPLSKVLVCLSTKNRNMLKASLRPFLIRLEIC